MCENLTAAARKAMITAEDEAQNFNHAYVGTEHILLGLVADGSGVMADVLAMFGVDSDKVRLEIEKFVQRGLEPVATRKLRLTPRAQRAIELAREEAQSVNEMQVGTEHLFLGLLRESDGLAGQVLRNLGIAPEMLRSEVLKIRIMQMKIVERAVRPVRAGILQKRKMREELLAHLAAIYDEEQARLHNPEAALAAATRRFGAPAELARELQSALPPGERIRHFAERWAQYRAPESAARFSLRMALRTVVLLAVVLGLVMLATVLTYGWIDVVQTMARAFAAILLLAPLGQFAVWLAYIKLRDAMWGAFGSRKSAARVLVLDLLIGSLAAALLFAVASIMWMDLRAALAAVPIYCTVGVLVALAALVLGRFSGLGEIRDTHWALLDIDAA